VRKCGPRSSELRDARCPRGGPGAPGLGLERSRSVRSLSRARAGRPRGAAAWGPRSSRSSGGACGRGRGRTRGRLKAGDFTAGERRRSEDPLSDEPIRDAPHPALHLAAEDRKIQGRKTLGGNELSLRLRPVKVGAVFAGISAVDSALGVVAPFVPWCAATTLPVQGLHTWRDGAEPSKSSLYIDADNSSPPSLQPVALSPATWCCPSL